MTRSEAVPSAHRYRALSGPQWKTLAAANLGWTLDSFEFFALFLTVGFSLHQLLEPAQYTAIPRYAGYIIATTLFGSATGGVIGGIVAGLYEPQTYDRFWRSSPIRWPPD